ncbi:ribonuclease activity regulator RraA [Actinopolymorpha pittospori]|uniref:Putative 4-hydroxy-4-methyl-2-oxoglutarate aldolase n=1 Tax=Actinopolymorpha pittospori TaxID=648752 RepID=A0A927N270_9ACTN|nr:ribonuclease activity regulator RraA [Actinopolymorpha pittospori]MBE1611300.1 regulator of RNase E activity RraA [Actinopolymorpha pittospori]
MDDAQAPAGGADGGRVATGQGAPDEPLPAEVLAALRLVSTATLTTQLMARGLRNTFLVGLRPLNSGSPRMVGTAFTLRYIPAREDLDVLSVFRDPEHPQRKAVESVGPGQVLVMDCRGRGRAASLGGILGTRLLRRGAAGVVTDGAVRDSPTFATLGLPAYSAGVSGTTNLVQHHAVDMQVPIGCAEVAVYPGDVMVGDAEGVVCVPRELAAEVASDAVAQEHLEEFVQAQIEAGAALPGVYPPNDATMTRYRAWAVDNPPPLG